MARTSEAKAISVSWDVAANLLRWQSGRVARVLQSALTAI